VVDITSRSTPQPSLTTTPIANPVSHTYGMSLQLWPDNLGCVILKNQYHALLDDAGVVKVEPRAARLEVPLVAIPEVTEKV
jgi:hypothetical protein